MAAVPCRLVRALLDFFDRLKAIGMAPYRSYTSSEDRGRLSRVLGSVPRSSSLPCRNDATESDHHQKKSPYAGISFCRGDVEDPKMTAVLQAPEEFGHLDV